MRPSLKLNAIEQEHLQEVYDAAGVARDELPYTEKFENLCQEFQDRAFKNAEPEQVYAALLKYTRTGGHAPTDQGPSNLTPEQIKQLKMDLRRHSRAGKVLPYSSEFEAALKEFNAHAGTNMSPGEFWQSILRCQNRSRRPPKRGAKPKVEREEDVEDDGE